jgi:D-glycero-D-manno-heptose 1,7-bisphosphate phosphatase
MQAVFLDRDGVINENRVDHVKSWSEFRFLPGAIEAIARLSQTGVRVFVVTNQAIINRGLVSRETVDDINRQMVRQLAARGGRIDAVAYCPHRPEDRCYCRKPQPGLLLRLAAGHGVQLTRSALIGDTLSDLQAGAAVGCRSVLVLTGRGHDQLAQTRAARLDRLAVAPDLAAAVEMLLSQSAWVA